MILAPDGATRRAQVAHLPSAVLGALPDGGA